MIGINPPPPITKWWIAGACCFKEMLTRIPEGGETVMEDPAHQMAHQPSENVPTSFK